MPIADFAQRRRIVAADGRRIVCRPPTVATVYRFLELFGVEIHALCEAVFERGAALSDDPVGELLPVFGPSPRLADVLDTCCELHGGAPGDLADLLAGRPDLQVETLRAVLGLCSVPRIAASLGLRAAFARQEAAPRPDPDDDPAPPRIDLALCAAALRYHTTPVAVATWPYEAFLSVDDVEGYLANKQAENAAHGPSRGVNLLAPADELAAQGIRVRRVKRRAAE